MRAFFSMVGANLKMQARNRTALFWLLVFPALFILLFGFLFSDDSGLTATAGVVNGGSSPLAARMTEAMERSSFFEVERSRDREAGIQRLREGELDAVLVFPERVAPGEPLRVEAYVDRSKLSTSQAVSAAIQQIADRFNRGPQQGPELVSVSTRGVQGRELGYTIDYLAPGFVAMSIMQNGVLGLATAFVVLRERGVLRRIRVTPFPLVGFIGARIVSNLIVVLCQVAILLGMARALFGLHVGGDVASVVAGVAVFSILGALAFLGIGFFVAGISSKVESANTLGNLITFPMLFLAGIFFPITQAPNWMQDVARALPLSYLADGLRQAMVYGTSISHLWTDVAALLATALVGFLLAVRFFRWEPGA
ncbi:ABC-2 type transporter [Rubrobacter xylanophilus DSM 9941]|uniref:ABC-2 type transporter n=1 Tax=Rubrobacter xylanophilus (strain DSM 9941 / JCM 11954 / NBRC 16129 / PRD-1) TaxID=266117 RepID=Q1AVR8_RUBXD|nr:ABC transporter permease [Rubrobacter xylanophilus]ABG04510.1 ABC-2 type transporter [Rubrobacter xylanophilus DSM 9941]